MLTTNKKGRRIQDLTGKKFNRLTVIELSEKTNNRGDNYWKCKCDCGKEKVIKSSNIKNGRTKSCGCLRSENMRKLGRSKYQKDRVVREGVKLGKLTILKRTARKSSNGMYLWKCLCECGKEVDVNETSLKLGVTRSCGCLRAESARLRGQRRKLPVEERIFRELYNTTKYHSDKRDREFKLTKARFKELIAQPCYYCGIKSSNHRTIQRRNEQPYTVTYNGVDRVDSSKGYIEGNVVSCCKNCNIAKQTMSISEYREFISRVYNHLILKNT